MPNIFPVPAHLIVDVWREVEPFIKKANSHSLGESDEIDYLCSLVKGAYQLWMIRDENELKAVCVTEILVYPKMSKLLIGQLCGEGMNEWLDNLISTLETFAKNNGCSYLEARGRKGWIKAAEHLNFKPTYQIISKEL